MKIKTIDNRGIRIIRDDGITFSIIFGAGSYCENYNKSITNQVAERPNTLSSDCEVAVIESDGEWITYKVFPEEGEHKDGSVDVAGYIPIEGALMRALTWNSSHE